MKAKRHAREEIRTWRENLRLSQQDVADVFGWKRDAVSKIETGKNNLYLDEYLVLVKFLAAGIPTDHPALALAERLRDGTR
jgi:transcriptional regulator with XRE-family HTH domain